MSPTHPEAAKAALDAYVAAKASHDDTATDWPVEVALQALVDDLNAYLETMGVFAKVNAGASTKTEMVELAYRLLYPTGSGSASTAQVALAIHTHLVGLFDAKSRPTVNHITNVVRSIKRG